MFYSAGGSYPPPPDVLENVPGLEFAGEVEALGPNVTISLLAIVSTGLPVVALTPNSSVFMLGR